MDIVKAPSWKRILVGWAIGAIAAFASFPLMAIPVLGIVIILFHSPVMLLITSFPFFTFYHYQSFVVVYGCMLGVLLGYVSNKRKNLMATILAIIVLTISSAAL